MATTSDNHALVLFSGGQDSATCLAWALDRYPHVETVGFDYGQRHAVELACRPPLRETLSALWPGRLGVDHLLDLRSLIAGLGETALTTDVAIETGRDGLPTTFVPGRNLLFLASAAALGWRRGLRRIVAGMCETDYSGYPDCRDDTIKAMQLAVSLGLARRFVLETPLMWRDKAETWRLAERLGGNRLVAALLDGTHSCYVGDRAHRHDWGYGCGVCPACALRAAGWHGYRAGGGGLEKEGRPGALPLDPAKGKPLESTP